MAALATAAVSLLQLSSSSSTGEATRDTGAEAETGAFSEDLAGVLALLLAGLLAGLFAGLLAGLLAAPDLVLRDLSCRAVVVVVETGVTGVITSPGLKWTWQTHCQNN